jgi:putative lipoprotein
MMWRMVNTAIGTIVGITVLSLSLGCAPAASSGQSSPPGPSTPQAERKLNGQVTYLQRIALPAGAVIDVSLDDVSLADAPATRVGAVSITTKGENVPIPFSISYDPTAVRPERSYAVSARITIEGQLRWITTTRHAVLTSGNPSDNVTVTVQPAGGSAAGQPSGTGIKPGSVQFSPSQGPPSVIGRWQLDRIDLGKDKVLTPSSPEKYIVEFSGGTLTARLDCNRGRGGYTVSGDTLKIDPILATLMACGSDSIAGDFGQALQKATSFRQLNDALVLSIGQDGGAIHLTRVP